MPWAFRNQKGFPITWRDDDGFILGIFATKREAREWHEAARVERDHPLMEVVIVRRYE